MDVLRFAAVATHLLATAIWLGAMTYSLAVVQPRSARFLGDERQREGFAAELAAGARRPVLALVAVLALSGAALAVAEAGDGQTAPWWALVGAKVALLVAAVALFAHVSWRLWPRRLFAPADELPAITARFRRAAWTLLGLVGVELILGAAAGTLAP